MRPSPLPPFCGRVTRQQRMYSFRREVFICVMFQVLNTFSLEKNAITTGTLILTLGSAFYVDKQLMFKLFTCR